MRPAILLLAALLGLSIHSHASSLNVGKQTYILVKQLTVREDALPAEEIARLAAIARTPRGTKEVGRILGKANLPDEVLEDTYLRIAVSQGHISAQDADGMFRRLRGTWGFRTTLGKLIGNSDVKSAGHLNELRIADTAAQHGLSVKAIGLRFNDPRKAADTDIDVLLERNGKLLAIEAKDYSASTAIPLDSFRADMDSLVEFAKVQSPTPVIPIFSITNIPADRNKWRLLQIESERRGVQLIVGSADEQVEFLKLLGDAL